MKKYYKIGFIISILSMFLFNNCGDDPEPGLWPNYVGEDKPAPVINSIESDKPALSGITEVRVIGQNFSANAEDNRVYFDGVRAETISSTPTEIRVRVPLVIGDSVEVKISSFKVENFSNVFIYDVNPAFEEYFAFDPNNNQKPVAITFDNSGNLIVSLDGQGIYKLTDSLRLFIPKGAETKWDALRIFSNGDIYAAKSIRGIWKLTEGVIPPNPPWGLTPAATFVKDFDFDSNTNLWGVGNNASIFRIRQDATVEPFSFNATLRAARVFNNYLYVAGLKSGVEGVWRFPIDANGNLGAEELYFSLTDSYPNVQTNSMTFSQEGDLYLGTNKEVDPIIVVHPNGSSEPLYPGVIPAADIISMYWPQGEKLYVTITATAELDQTVIWIDIQKPGAVYFNQ